MYTLDGLYSLLHLLISDPTIESALMEHFGDLIRFVRGRSSQPWAVRCSGASEGDVFVCRAWIYAK